MFNNSKIIYYIDESGDLDPIKKNNSKAFLVGCVIINNVENQIKNIDRLHKIINNSAYFERHKTDKYFHASTDHPDVYAKFMDLINSLDFRAYIVVLNKNTQYFNDLSKSKSQIYNDLIFKLLYDRLLKRKENNNLLFFENINNKLGKEKKEKENIILNINNTLKSKSLIKKDLNFKVEIKNKQDALITIVDYVIHVVGSLYEGKNGKVENRMKENFKLIENKIGVIIDVANKKYHKPRKEKINIDDFFIKNL